MVAYAVSTFRRPHASVDDECGGTVAVYRVYPCDPLFAFERGPPLGPFVLHKSQHVPPYCLSGEQPLVGLSIMGARL